MSEFALDLAVSAFELNEFALDLEVSAVELNESARHLRVSPPKDLVVGEEGESNDEDASVWVVVGVRSSGSELVDS